MVIMNYLNRKIETYDKNGELIETTFREVDYNEVRKIRNMLLKESDLYLLQDIYDSLTEEQKNELITFRQDLRELPQNYPNSANDAADNLPIIPEWFK